MKRTKRRKQETHKERNESERERERESVCVCVCVYVCVCEVTKRNRSTSLAGDDLGRSEEKVAESEGLDTKDWSFEPAGGSPKRAGPP